MKRKIDAKKSFPFRLLVVAAALAWVATDVAIADQGSARSSRSPGSSKSTASSSKSSRGSRASGW